MKSRVCAVAIAALFVSACASSYPDLVTFKPGPAGEELRTILDEAMTLQRNYATGYKETARWQDLSQLPIIGAATAAGFVLLNDHDNAAKTVGKIGIGTLTYTNVRGQFTAAGLPEIYIAGHGALTCILAEGSYFEGAAAKLRHDKLLLHLDETAQGMQLTTKLRYLPVTEGDQAEALKAARAVADQALAAAQAAEAAALTQESHYLSAAPAFRNAVANVSVRVASKGRVRPPIDYATLRDQMVPPKPPAAAGDNGGGTEAELVNTSDNDPKVVIQQMMLATRNLTSSTARLTAATPRYSESLKRVDECPAKVRLE